MCFGIYRRLQIKSGTKMCSSEKACGGCVAHRIKEELVRREEQKSAQEYWEKVEAVASIGIVEAYLEFGYY